jgi:hypothetical protein
MAGCLLLLGLLVAAPPAMAAEGFDRTTTAAPDSAYDGLRATAQRGGTVRVIAGLRLRFAPEGTLSRGARATQRGAIDDATRAVQRALAGTSHRVIHTYETVPFVALELSSRALDRLRSSRLAATLHEDVPEDSTLAQSRPLVEGTEGVAFGRTGAGRTIAVLDTGIQKTHSFLQQSSGVPKVVSEACYSDGDDCPGGLSQSTASGSGVPCTYAPAGCRHGTHVAGIAAGKGTSFSGIARESRLISINVFSRFDGPASCPNEDPCTRTFQSDQIKGLERVFALRNTFSIAAVNMSLGGGKFTSACNTDPRKPAIDNLKAANIATVIASGNDGFIDGVSAPGCISTAVTVGSTTKSDQISGFSNSDETLDLLAPGSQINSSVPPNTFAVFDGTSMATPHVAGAFAVMEAAVPTATPDQILAALNATGKPITDVNGITRDRIRVFSATTWQRATGFTSGISFPSLTGGGMVSNGVGLAKRPGALTPPATGNIVISGIPAGARVRAAYLVWQTVGAPDPVATFQGVGRAGTLVGGSANTGATNFGGAVRTYRYSVPLSQVPGNGTYSVGGVGGVGGGDGQGASLIVVYDLARLARTGRVYLRFGALTGRPPSTLMSHTFSGLSVPSAVVGPALHVGVGDGQSFTEPAMQFQSTPTLFSNITPANFWTGSDGTYWDDKRIALSPSLLPVGTTFRVNRQSSGGDWLTWGYAGLTYRH